MMIVEMVDLESLKRLVGNPSSKIRQLASASELRVILALCELLTIETGDLPPLNTKHLREVLHQILDRLCERSFAPYLRED